MRGATQSKGRSDEEMLQVVQGPMKLGCLKITSEQVHVFQAPTHCILSYYNGSPAIICSVSFSAGAVVLTMSSTYDSCPICCCTHADPSATQDRSRGISSAGSHNKAFPPQGNELAGAPAA